VAASTIVALVWILSVPTYRHGRIQFGYRISPTLGISIIDGCFSAGHLRNPSPISTTYRIKWVTWLPPVGYGESLYGVRLPELRDFGYFRRCIIPLWMPFILIAGPTAFLWQGDRRRVPVGHCRQCGYDLTKNESGVCPECGGEIEQSERELCNS